MRDLIVLVADLDMEQAIRGILSRWQSLQIRSLDYEIMRHPNRDPGCFTQADELLRSQSQTFAYALVLFDHEGSGQEKNTPQTIQDALEERLAQKGWGDRARVIVIQPELEIWLWSDSPHVEEILGWKGRNPTLWEWLQARGFLDGGIKPQNPKAAYVKAAKEAGKRLSAAIFKAIAESVSLKHCQDPAFLRFKETLQAWFPAQQG